MAIMSEKEMKRLNRLAGKEEKRKKRRRKYRDQRIRFEVWSWQYERFFSFWRGALKAIILTPITVALSLVSMAMRLIAYVSSVGLIVSGYYFIQSIRAFQNEVPFLEIPELPKALYWLAIPFVVYTVAIVTERFYWYLDAVRQAPPKKRRSVFDEMQSGTKKELDTM